MKQNLLRQVCLSPKYFPPQLVYTSDNGITVPDLPPRGALPAPPRHPLRLQTASVSGIKHQPKLLSETPVAPQFDNTMAFEKESFFGGVDPPSPAFTLRCRT